MPLPPGTSADGLVRVISGYDLACRDNNDFLGLATLAKIYFAAAEHYRNSGDLSLFGLHEMYDTAKGAAQAAMEAYGGQSIKIPGFREGLDELVQNIDATKGYITPYGSQPLRDWPERQPQLQPLPKPAPRPVAVMDR